MKEYFSHTGKPLQNHLQQVAAKTRNRTHLKIAEIAALFHDLGKVNPNFQRKLKGEKNLGYSSHAYLSALAWLCFFETNKTLAKKILDGDASFKYSVAAMLARHHGNLPNMDEGFLNCDECDRLKKFIRETIAEELPISQFLQTFYPHNDFPTKVEDRVLKHFLDEFPLKFKSETLPKITDKLSFFLNTQFGFACLIESDKRDAGENETFRSKDLSNDFQEKFSINLNYFLKEIENKSANEKDEKKKRLDAVRSQMRELALTNLREFLSEEKDRRVFTLPAPTGAGKTLMLLSLANEILKVRADLKVIYALPFLAITGQTENICLDILQDSEKVLRVDSKAENKEIENLQRILDGNPSDENVKKLLQQLFSNETFDHPFIITTFVQVFETLVSNRNATLLRLPNFSKTIFLLDEIQALPPSLYTFFVAYLDEFCRKFDSYAIVSTATMPHLQLPDEKNYEERQKPSKVFTRYKEPKKILDERFYDYDEFNRYKIIPKFEIESISNLAEEIRNQKESCLIVLNTIKDTKTLFKELNGNSESQIVEGKYILLNTHFTLEDRQRKLAECQRRLNDKEKKEKVVLISTQLIEAGVDIDFPIVYRDLCPLPNLIQTAGRCNRNYKLDFGEVYFFEIKDEGKSSANKIYGRNFHWFLDFTKEEINQTIYEKDILTIQKRFADDKVSKPLTFGLYESKTEKVNLVECINQIRFEDLSKVKLIDADYGVQNRYYIPIEFNSETDKNLKELKRLIEKQKLVSKRDFDQIRMCRSEIEKVLKQMSKRTVSVRISEFQEQKGELLHLGRDEICGIIRIPDDKRLYSPIAGLEVKFEGAMLI